MLWIYHKWLILYLEPTHSPMNWSALLHLSEGSKVNCIGKLADELDVLYLKASCSVEVINKQRDLYCQEWLLSSLSNTQRRGPFQYPQNISFDSSDQFTLTYLLMKNDKITGYLCTVMPLILVTCTTQHVHETFCCDPTIVMSLFRWMGKLYSI